MVKKLVEWAEGFRKGALEVEHNLKGSGGDFLMVLRPFFFFGLEGGFGCPCISQMYNHSMGVTGIRDRLHSLRENFSLSSYFSDFPGSKNP